MELMRKTPPQTRFDLLRPSVQDTVLQRSQACAKLHFNSVQRALVLEDYAPPALPVHGFVSRKKGASSMGEEKKEGGKKKNNK